MILLQKLIFVKILLIIFIIISSCEEQERPLKKIDVKFETLAEIGADSDVFFSFPVSIVLSSSNDFFVADAGLSKIFKFSSEGKLLSKFGENGPGPDQFRRIAGMTINANNELIIFDNVSQSFKVFSEDGRFIESFNSPTTITSNVEFILHGQKVSLAFAKYTPESQENFFLHTFSNDFNKLVTKSISVYELSNYNDTMLALSSFDTGSYLFLRDRLFFAPYIYDGSIYEYGILNNMFTAKPKKSYKGFTQKQSLSLLNANSQQYSDVKFTIRNQSQKILIHNQSKGLFRLNNQKIIHFTYIENKQGTERIFGAEVFDLNMKLLGYAEIKRKKFVADPSGNNFLNWQIHAKDNHDRFYLIDKEKNPKIKIVQIKFDDQSHL